ncbi:MAG: PAS domain S-box protein [Deltaproteobacteria bacterium]|nr:MAG: PAS domain S-box protein [Deltaproteobacteria bacterium]
MTPEPGQDEALADHLRRVEGYMRGCVLLRYPRTRGPLRDELAQALGEIMPASVRTWVEHIGRAFRIAESQWPGLTTDIDASMQRWIRHIADPEDCDTYVYLRSHARRGFISKFPASRFLSGQIKMFQILAEHLRGRYAGDRPHRAELLALFEQECDERILHITDFFVEAREEQLREQEATYRRSIDNAPAAIFRIGWDDGAILSANIVAEQSLGHSSEELRAMHSWDLHPADERDAARRLWDDTRRYGNASREDLHVRTRSGAIVPVFINSGVIEYGDQRFIQQICVDISDRKLLEDKLIQSEKMAAIGQLAAGIAHEIRNPLGIIMNALYDLSEVVDGGNAEVREDLKIAREEMDRVQAIINNLLEFSRASTVDLEPVDVNDLLRKTLMLMNKYLQSSEVRVETEFAATGFCSANQNALRQIFLNLITNAVQAMPHGGELRIRTSLVSPTRLRLEFTDTGVGIPEPQLKDIFNPFYTTKSPGQGTGLGLSVVHSVVRRYRGEIRVASTPNVGTTFTIELPTGHDTAEAAAG